MSEIDKRRSQVNRSVSQDSLRRYQGRYSTSARSFYNVYKISGIGNNVGVEMKYFLIEGMILPRQGIKKVTTGCYRFRTVGKFYIRIYYGIIKRYTFSFNSKSERGNILLQLLRCLNCDHR